MRRRRRGRRRPEHRVDHGEHVGAGRDEGAAILGRDPADRNQRQVQLVAPALEQREAGPDRGRLGRGRVEAANAT